MQTPTGDPLCAKTFISYSRRQLYFAEAIALHLQKHKIDVWFDLQQLQAGTVWSDGLDSGVQTSGRLILVVSKASLDSPWTQAEWKKVLEEGKPVVLAIREPVDLPEILEGLPSFDFQRGFGKNIGELAAYLKAEAAEPRRDPVSKPNRIGLSLKMPNAVWLTIAVLLLPAAVPLFAVLRGVPAGWQSTLMWIFLGMAVLIAALYPIPLWRHTIKYRRLKRGVLFSLLLQILSFPISFIILSDSGPSLLVPFLALAFVTIPTAFVYVLVLRRSAGILHWLQPSDDLQALRRRLHQPMVSLANKSWEIGKENPSDAKALRFAVHSDPADAPFARRIKRIIAASGHLVVGEDENPQHHIAVITNRSSQNWVQEMTTAYSGKLVCVIGSTIELTESLSETADLQWVDSRNGDKRDIQMLVSALADPEAARRESALEATPTMIDLWKLPLGITLLKRVIQFYLFMFLISILGEIDVTFQWYQHLTQALGTIGMAGALYWLFNKAIIERRLPAVLVYALIALIGVAMFVIPGDILHVLPLLKKQVVIIPAVCLLLFSMRDGIYWFPAFARSQTDEVGLKKTIWKKIRRRNIGAAVIAVAILAWAIFQIGVQ